MADRQRFCVIILCLLTICSATYLGYFLFIDSHNNLIQKFNRIRLYIFFAQHLISLGMCLTLLKVQENDNVIVWIFQLSGISLLMFIGGQVYTGVKGGKIFGAKQIISFNEVNQDVLEFQINEVTLYFQIMTDFALFFIVSGIAIVVMKCRAVQQEERYEFMIEKLKSEDFVDDPHAAEKKPCSICLADLDSQRVLKSPCGHIFHKDCLRNWLKRSSVCPLCRNDIQQSLDPNSPYLRENINFESEESDQQRAIQLPPPVPQRQPPQRPQPISLRLNAQNRVRRQNMGSRSERNQQNSPANQGQRIIERNIVSVSQQVVGRPHTSRERRLQVQEGNRVNLLDLNYQSNQGPSNRNAITERPVTTTIQDHQQPETIPHSLQRIPQPNDRLNSRRPLEREENSANLNQQGSLVTGQNNFVNPFLQKTNLQSPWQRSYQNPNQTDNYIPRANNISQFQNPAIRNQMSQQVM